MSNPDPRCCLGLPPEECARVPTNQCDGLREKAERRVIAVRGSDDVPGFDMCVEAELLEMMKSKWGR